MKTSISAADDAAQARLSRLAAVDGAGVTRANGAAQAKASAAALRAGIRVDRVVSELRRGRPVRLGAGTEHILVAAVESMLPSAWFRLSAAGGELTVTLTAERAQASGLHKPAVLAAVSDHAAVPLPLPLPLPAGVDADGPPPLLPITLRLPEGFDPARLADLAGLGSHGAESGGEHVDLSGDGGDGARLNGERWASLLAAQSAAPSAQTTPALRAALELARLARLVPAVVALRLPERGLVRLGADGTEGESGIASRSAWAFQSDAEENPEDPEYLRVSAADVRDYPQDRAGSLLRVSEAPVPLAGHEDSRFVLFRETVADLEHVAIIVGSPDPAEPVVVRLHSSCLTGDLFASLRCDCGDQLRGGIDRLGDSGGVLLYLAQEGRGIGLANKLRAYARQDTGLDTIDADRYLGFRGDERNFAVAVQMLKALGIGRIRLLTNNPAKIAALRQAGLDVVERLAIGGQINRHNERYITTKRDRAGHLIDASTLPVARQAG